MKNKKWILKMTVSDSNKVEQLDEEIRRVHNRRLQDLRLLYDLLERRQKLLPIYKHQWVYTSGTVVGFLLLFFILIYIGGVVHHLIGLSPH